MAEADNIKQICERFGNSATYDTRHTQVAQNYSGHPKYAARRKAMELAALLSVMHSDPENVTSLNEVLKDAFFEHLNDLGAQVLALTELVAEQ
jgi:hypothetical protein